MAGSLSQRQLRAIVALPGMMAGVVPAVLSLTRRDGLELELLPRLAFLVVGVALLAIGLSLVARTIQSFAEVGEGTLAPWDAPRRLVVHGVYRFVRNPMISGVVAVLLGEAAGLASTSLLVWAAAFAMVNMLYIALVEERSLARRFGEQYLEYRRHVPAWIPRLTPWEPSSGAGG